MLAWPKFVCACCKLGLCVTVLEQTLLATTEAATKGNFLKVG